MKNKTNNLENTQNTQNRNSKDEISFDWKRFSILLYYTIYTIALSLIIIASLKVYSFIKILNECNKRKIKGI